MTGYIGLGSNAGDRLGRLRAACDELERRGIRVAARSSVYETAPQGEVLDQPDFLNAVVRVETDLDARALLAACKDIEGELGRASGGERHGPRPVDLDLLLLGDEEHASEGLRVPHAEITGRRFVLEPLLELDAELRLPDGTRLARLLPSVRDQRVERAGPL